ncbi:MAG: LptF/LptG family permease [Chloroflexi bacterium]|nr:LptF/LptG family permease [Chloroflexota bacterium]
MKLLDRYLVGEVENPFLIGLSAFLTVLCLNMVYFVLDLIVEKEAPLREILQLIVLRLPFFLVLAMPVAVLLSVSLAVSRITRDQELIALRMAGLSLWRILLPFAALGVILAAASFGAEEWLAPLATHRSDNLYRRLLLESDVPSLTPDTFFRSDTKVFYFHRATRIGERTLRLDQVVMFQLNGSNFPEIWSAREALVRGETWTLIGVVMHHLDEHGSRSVDAVPDQDPVLDLHKDMSFFLNAQKLPEEKTASQLQAQMAGYRRSGVTGLMLDQLEYEYWVKFALPAACLLCALIGVPLNIRYARLGGYVGLFFSLVGVFLYYNSMVLARFLSYQGTLPGVVGAWLPDGLFGFVCLIFIYREL